MHRYLAILTLSFGMMMGGTGCTTRVVTGPDGGQTMVRQADENAIRSAALITTATALRVIDNEDERARVGRAAYEISGITLALIDKGEITPDEVRDLAYKLIAESNIKDKVYAGQLVLAISQLVTSWLESHQIDPVIRDSESIKLARATLSGVRDATYFYVSKTDKPAPDTPPAE